MGNVVSLDAALAEAERSDPAFEWQGRMWRMRPAPAPIFVRLLRRASAASEGDSALAERIDAELRELLGASDDYALLQGLMVPEDWAEFEKLMPSLAVIGEIGRNLLKIYAVEGPESSPSSAGSRSGGRGRKRSSKPTTAST